MQRGPEEWPQRHPQGRRAGPNERTVILPRGAAAPPGQAYPGQARPGPGYPGHVHPEHRPVPPPGYREPPPYDRRPPSSRLPQRPRRTGRRILGLLIVLAILLAGLFVFMDRRLARANVLRDYEGRPAATPGEDWLIVGSDSREELTDEQKAELATGDAAGGRTDTIMLLHIPRDGQPTLVSLPRDSYVPIPGHGRNKINAAFAFGGPTLLTQTVEQVTGIRVDHYAEVGFDGFATLVDAVGGVELCVKERMRDPNAGLNLKPGCQVLDSAEALGYVRTRASAQGDLDRVQRQREFLGALMSKAVSPGVLLNPVRAVPLVNKGPGTVTVDDDDHLHHLARLGLAMRAIGRGQGVTTTVPVAGGGSVPGVGSVVLWNREEAIPFFEALAADRPVPAAS